MLEIHIIFDEIVPYRIDCDRGGNVQAYVRSIETLVRTTELNKSLEDTQASLLQLAQVVVAELALQRKHHVALASQLFARVLEGWRKQAEGTLEQRVVTTGLREHKQAVLFSPSFFKT